MHKKLTGVSNKNTLAFAKWLDEKGKSVWIRHVLLEGYTDNDEYLKQTAEFIKTLNNVEKIEVLPYHTMGEVEYEKLGLEYPLKGVPQLLKEEGYNYSYIHYTYVAQWYEKLGYETVLKWTKNGIL